MNHIRFKIMLIYRVPDSNTESDSCLFDDILHLQPNLALGDINLDWKKEENKTLLKSKIPFLKQIVNKITRVGVDRNLQPTNTCIDHIYIRPNWAGKTKYYIKDCRSISDHRIVHFNIDIAIPSRKITLSPKLDKKKRYFPEGGVDWAKFDFQFDEAYYSKMTDDAYYSGLVKSMIEGCNKARIVQKDRLKPKKVFRFNLSRQCRNLIKFRDQVHFKWNCSNKVLQAIIAANDPPAWLSLIHI